MALAVARPGGGGSSAGGGAAITPDEYCASNFAIDRSSYNGWSWDFSFLGDKNYVWTDPVSGSVWTWNYCSDVLDTDDLAVQQTTEADGSVTTFEWGTEPMSMEDFHGDCVVDDDGEMTSCSSADFTILTKNQCIAPSAEGADDAVYYGFQTLAQCVPTPEGQEAAETTQVGGVTISADGCTSTVTFAGPDACANYSNTLNELSWIHLYIFFGPFIGIFGLRIFPYTMPTLVWTTVMLVIWLAGTTSGFTQSAVGYYVTSSLGFILASGLACYGVGRHIKNTLGLTSACGGVFLGLYLFTVLEGIVGGWSIWIMWVFVSVLGTVGFLAGTMLGVQASLWSTSFSGAYLFIRAIVSMFTNAWPTEATATTTGSNSTPEPIDPIFWVFAALILVCTGIWGYMQIAESAHNHSDIDD